MLVNLGLVTRALVVLLENGIRVSDGWSGTTPEVTPAPPDIVSEDALGLYLYHVGEDPHFKTAAVPSGGSARVRHAPMGLRLHYQLTAHNRNESQDAVYTAQQLLGCAVKVLHDFPVVDDSTIVGGANILGTVGLDGADNVLRIALQPVQYTEAVSYWTAGTGPARLAAYYQVDAVLLEPERLETRSGRVLAYGIQVFTVGAPRLEGSRNTLTFTNPAGQAANVELRPAQASFGDAFTLTGLGLAGDKVAVSLRSAAWDAAEIVDGIAWGVAATADRVIAQVQPSIGPRDLLPGTYDAAVHVTRTRATPAGPRDFTHKSNVVPIVVTPMVTAVNVTGPDTLSILGPVFQHPDLPPETVEVHIDGIALAPDENGVLEPGEFNPTATQIDVRLPPEVRRGTRVLVRVLVNGAEAAPRWETIP